MKAYFHHYSLAYGLGLGWDYESDYDGFCEERKSRFMSDPALSVKGITVSEWDIYMLSKGKIASDEAKIFFDYLVASAKNCGTKDMAFLVSNHSGSSDYLLASKVLKEYASFTCV